MILGATLALASALVARSAHERVTVSTAGVGRSRSSGIPDISAGMSGNGAGSLSTALFLIRGGSSISSSVQAKDAAEIRLGGYRSIPVERAGSDAFLEGLDLPFETPLLFLRQIWATSHPVFSAPAVKASRLSLAMIQRIHQEDSRYHRRYSQQPPEVRIAADGRPSP
eukprot:scaffold43409_cov41-Cyclotella_meneghiniana.AAC.4